MYSRTYRCVMLTENEQILMMDRIISVCVFDISIKIPELTLVLHFFKIIKSIEKSLPYKNRSYCPRINDPLSTLQTSLSNSDVYT
jgi:hypothetical protein